MKKIILLYVTFFIVFVATAPVVAAGCRLQGSWMGFDDNGVPTWVAGIHGQSASHGTNELEYPAFTISTGVVDGTQMRGSWERRGGNMFAYTMLGYGYDAFGTPVYINKINGTLTLSEDCNTAAVTADINIYICDEPSPAICPDPFTDTPDDEPPFPTTYAIRVMVE